MPVHIDGVCCLPLSSFELCHSFVIRHSGFVIGSLFVIRLPRRPLAKAFGVAPRRRELCHFFVIRHSDFVISQTSSFFLLLIWTRQGKIVIVRDESVSQ
jgi:hypothetical protein